MCVFIPYAVYTFANIFLPCVSCFYVYFPSLPRPASGFQKVALDHHLHFHTPLFVCLCICELTGGGRETWRAETGGAWGREHHWGVGCGVGVGGIEGVFTVT